jgi:hypothetical protein
MFNHARKYVSGTRAALAGAVVCGSLVLSLGIAVPSSSAFGSSKFCQTILTYETKYASNALVAQGVQGVGQVPSTLL